MCIDIKSFYLGTSLDRFEYMRIPLDMSPQHIIDQYDLLPKAKNGFIYVEIRKAIYGLPQAGALANKLLKKRLAPAGYYEVPHTPGLWKHIHRPIAFSLVVDDFGVKYVGKAHADHLIRALKKDYELSEDWGGGLYCGITLKWDYKNRTLDFSMPGYIKAALERYKHSKPTKPQHSPYPVAPRKYGAAAQEPADIDESPAATPPRNYTHPASRWNNHVLCKSSRPHSPCHPLNTSERTSAGDPNYDQSNTPHARLLSNPPRRDDEILRLRHGPQHPFGRLIHECARRKEQGLWAFLPGMAPP